MKHFILSSMLLMSCAFVGVAHAQDDATTTDDSNTRPWYEFRKEQQEARQENREEVRNEMQERREEMQEVREQNRETLRARFDEFKKARIENLLDLMKRRFSWAIERLENIADRIESRITKIEDERDVDLSDASAHLADGREHIDAAQEALDAISTSSEDVIDEEKESAGFAAIRETFDGVKTEIKAAWEDLRLALEAIKAGRPSDDTNESDSSDEDGE